MNRETRIKGVQLSIRAAVAAGVSLALAQSLELEFPIYSFLAAIIVTDLSPAQTRRLGWRRLVATIVGATCGAALSMVLPPSPWVIGSAVLMSMLACNLIRMQEGAKVGGYICAIVLLTHHEHPWSYACFRLVETLVGVGVAWLISLVPKLIRIDAARSA